MFLSRLQLEQFRSYEHLAIDIPESGFRLFGRNASGKTSVLEALVLLSTTRSPRTTVDRELVRWGSGEDFGVFAYTRMEGTIVTSNRVEQVAISLELDAERQTNQRKQYQLNGEPVRALDLVGVLKTVLFSPEDVMLITGAPPERRRQLDIFISQIDRVYLASLSQYGRVLAQRNQLLKRFSRERRGHRDIEAITEISFWDDKLVSSGAIVVAARMKLTEQLNAQMMQRSESLVDGATVGVSYVPRMGVEGLSPSLELKSLREAVASRFAKGLEEVRREEFRRGMTLLGPHRDEFTFLINGVSLASYGSRGQQRLGIVAFRLAQISILEALTGEKPVLLLDDVFSELDERHRDMLIGEVTRFGCQLFLTATESEVLAHPGLTHITPAEVSLGNITVS